MFINIYGNHFIKSILKENLRKNREYSIKIFKINSNHDFITKAFIFIYPI